MNTEQTTAGASIGSPVNARAMEGSTIERYLYEEAELLDVQDFDSWLRLFTDDCIYEIPPTDVPDGDAASTLFLVHDDRRMLEARVRRMQSKNVHAENPHSRTRRFISNVRWSAGDDALYTVAANFIVYRFRYGVTDTYVGQYRYVLVDGDDGLKIRTRRAVLDMEALRPSGKISIIL